MPHIILDNVSLDFPIYDALSRSLTRSIVEGIPVGGIIKKNKGEKASILALDNVTFTLEDGDRVALLGHNGAGKTSLLKLLAGFYEPTSGTISSSGKVSVLLELMAGMDLYITGYENIVLCGMLRGLSRREITAKQEDIARFSELGSYLDIPVRLYSQGMMLRLAFAICTSIECEVLLLDEWVGAGDQTFLLKAKERLSDMVFRSSILVLATHSLEVASQLCNKAMYLEHGKMLMYGEINDVLKFQAERIQGDSLRQ